VSDDLARADELSLLEQQAIAFAKAMRDMSRDVRRLGPEPTLADLRDFLADRLGSLRSTRAQFSVSTGSAAAPAPADVVAFYWLVENVRKMWNESGRYGTAGLKVRRALIVLLSLIIITFVLDVGFSHLSEQQVADLTAAEGALGIAVAVVGAAKKN
jgi:hypothetical protein